MSEIVCIAGSMKNWESILYYAGILTMNGDVVLTPYKVPEWAAARYRDQLDTAFRKKIDMCDYLYVIGEPGESVKAEMRYALDHGKPVRTA